MPRISKKISISPNFSLYNNRGEYDNGADYFTGDLIYYAGDWWHCYNSAHLSPGYPPPSRPECFVQITFKNKIISKTTEIKNLIAAGDIQKLQQKLLRSDKKVNSIVKQKAEQRIIASLKNQNIDDEDYINVNDFNSGAFNFNTKIIKFGNKSIIGFNANYTGQDNSYRYTGFNPNPANGNNRIRVIAPFSKQGLINSHIDSGESWITNLIPFLRDDAWIFWDVEDNIFYYNFNIKQSDPTNFMPLKGWVRTNLFKTPIEVKIENKPQLAPNSSSSGSSTSGSGSGSGSGDGVLSVGMRSLNNAIDETRKFLINYGGNQSLGAIIQKAWNYFINSDTSLRPKDIVNLFVDKQNEIVCIHQKPYILRNDVSSPERFTFFNDRSDGPVAIFGFANFNNNFSFSEGASVASTNANLGPGNFYSKYLLKRPNDNYISAFDSPNIYRNPIKIKNDSQNSFFEIYQNGKVYRSIIEGQESFDWHLLCDDDTVGDFRSLFTDGVYNGLFFSEGEVPCCVKDLGSITVIDLFPNSAGNLNAIYSVNRINISNITTKDEIKKIITKRTDSNSDTFEIVILTNAGRIFVTSINLTIIYPGQTIVIANWTDYSPSLIYYKDITYNFIDNQFYGVLNNNTVLNIKHISGTFIITSNVKLISNALGIKFIPYQLLNGWYGGVYWIDDVATTLNQYGTGFWNENLYVNGISGDLIGSGSSGVGVGLSLINQALKDLNFTGVIYNRKYVNGDLIVGWFQDKYYINGLETTLDSNGSGNWGDKYYINAVETPLNSNGSGPWNNNFYQNGQIAQIPSVLNYTLTVEGSELLISNYSGPSGPDVDITVPGEVQGFKINGVKSNSPALSYKTFRNVNYDCSNLKANTIFRINATNFVFGPNAKIIEDNAFTYVNITNLSIPNSIQFNNFSAYATIDNLILSSNHQSLFNSINHNSYFTGKITCLNNIKYFIGGAQIPYLNDESGNPFTGLSNGKYYLNGVQTKLNTNGTGAWRGKVYRNGVEISMPTITNYEFNVEDRTTWHSSYIDFNSYLLLRYVGQSSSNLDLTLPSEVDGVAIDGISGYAFQNKTLKSIIIPNSFKFLSGYAFYNVTLDNLTVSGPLLNSDFGYAFNNANIKDLIISGNPSFLNKPYIFTYARIENLEIPNSITNIEYSYTFSNAKIKNLIIPPSITNFSHDDDITNKISYYAFSNFTGGITYLGVFAYYINSIRTTLPPTGTGFWNNKYYINGVETTLPSSGTGVWNNKYYVSGVETTLPSSGTGVWNNKYYVSGVETTLDVNGNGVWDYNFYQNAQITSIPSVSNYSISIQGNGFVINQYFGPSGSEVDLIIPNQFFGVPVIRLSHNLLSGKTFNSITTPSSLHFVNGQSFSNVTVNNFIILNGPSIIDDFSFANSIIQNITIPNSITRIDSDSFANAQILNLIIPNTVTEIESEAFNGAVINSLTLPQAFSTELNRIGINPNINITYT